MTTMDMIKRLERLARDARKGEDTDPIAVRAIEGLALDLRVRAAEQERDAFVAESEASPLNEIWPSGEVAP